LTTRRPTKPVAPVMAIVRAGLSIEPGYRVFDRVAKCRPAGASAIPSEAIAHLGVSQSVYFMSNKQLDIT